MHGRYHRQLSDMYRAIIAECEMALGKADAQTALARATAVQLAQSEAAVQRADEKVTELTNELADREEELAAVQRKLVSAQGLVPWHSRVQVVSTLEAVTDITR